MNEEACYNHQAGKATAWTDLPAELRQRILNLLIPPWAFRRHITSKVVTREDEIGQHTSVVWRVKDPIYTLPEDMLYDKFEVSQIHQITTLIQVCRQMKEDMRVLQHVDYDHNVIRHASIDIVMFMTMLNDPNTKWPETLVLDLFYHEEDSSVYRGPFGRGEWDDVCGIDVLDKQSHALKLALYHNHVWVLRTGGLVGRSREQVSGSGRPQVITKAVHFHMKYWIQAASKYADRSRNVVVLVDFGREASQAGWQHQLRWRDLHRLMAALQHPRTKDGVARQVQLVGEQPQQLVEELDVEGENSALWSALGGLKQYWADRRKRVE